jgi:hypothetical protein
MKEENSHRTQNRYIRVAYNTESTHRYCRRRSFLVTQCHTHTSADILELEAPASTVAPMITNRFQQAPWLQRSHRDFHRHRGLEHRSSNDYLGFTSTVALSTVAPTNSHTTPSGQPRYFTIYLYSLLELTSASHLNFSLLHCPRFLFHLKQSPIVLVASYYFIICRINVDTAAP